MQVFEFMLMARMRCISLVCVKVASGVCNIVHARIGHPMHSLLMGGRYVQERGSSSESCMAVC